MFKLRNKTSPLRGPVFNSGNSLMLQWSGKHHKYDAPAAESCHLKCIKHWQSGVEEHSKIKEWTHAERIIPDWIWVPTPDEHQCVPKTVRQIPTELGLHSWDNMLEADSMQWKLWEQKISVWLLLNSFYF